MGVMVAPIIPGLTEHEMPAILKAAAAAGCAVGGLYDRAVAHGGLVRVRGVAGAPLSS